MKLNITKQINKPLAYYEREVTKSGNGAIVYVEKKFIGRKAIIVIQGDKNE